MSAAIELNDDAASFEADSECSSDRHETDAAQAAHSSFQFISHYDMRNSGQKRQRRIHVRRVLLWIRL